MAQFLALQVALHHGPHGLVIAQADQARDLPEHGREPIKWLGGKLREAYIKNTAGMGQESKVALAIARFDPADFGQRILQRSTIIKMVAIGKFETIPRFEWH